MQGATHQPEPSEIIVTAEVSARALMALRRTAPATAEGYACATSHGCTIAALEDAEAKARVCQALPSELRSVAEHVVPSPRWATRARRRRKAPFARLRFCISRNAVLRRNVAVGAADTFVWTGVKLRNSNNWGYGGGKKALHSGTSPTRRESVDSSRVSCDEARNLSAGPARPSAFSGGLTKQGAGPLSRGC